MKAAFLLPLLVASLDATAAEPVRIWNSNDGKHSARAQYIAVKENSVLLLKESGQLVNVPFARLSKADNIYVAQVIQQEIRARNAPAAAGAVVAPPAAIANAPIVPQAAAAIPPKINVIVGEDDRLKARNEQATENDRKANLRQEQLGVDNLGTTLNTRLSALTARAQQVRLEGQQVEQQIASHRDEITRRNIDIEDARANGAWDIVSNHMTQLALLRDRLAALQRDYASLSAEYAGLDQQAAAVREQLAALENKYYDIEDEIAVPVAQPPQNK